MITEKVCSTERPTVIDYLPLPTGEVDLFMRKNIEEVETEDGKMFTYDEAYMRMPSAEPTQAEVVNNFDKWYDMAAAWTPPVPIPEPTPEERLSALEAENATLKAQLDVAMEAIDYIIMEG